MDDVIAYNEAVTYTTTTRRLFTELVALLRRLREQGNDIEQIRHDSPELSELRDWASGEGVPEHEWRRQVTRARAYVRRKPKPDKRMDSSMRWQNMQRAVFLLRADPTLTQAELAHLLGINRTTARRYWGLAWEVLQGSMSVEEAVWGAAGRRGRPRKYLELPVRRPEIARAVAAALTVAQETGDDCAAMRRAALAVLDDEEDAELAVRLARQMLNLEV